MKTTLSVGIIGAGPYALAAAAHLRAAGADTHVFGKVMSFWRCHMPVGMRLRSPWRASHIADPQGQFTLDRYVESGRTLERPVPLDDFVRYGEWFQNHAVPSVDDRRVRTVSTKRGALGLVLEDGEEMEFDRVIVAAGLKDHVHLPANIEALPRSFATHSSEHGDLSRFANRRIIVIGAGQSAVETAALVQKTGADVELIARTQRLHWVGSAPSVAHVRVMPGPVLKAAKHLYPPSEVGPFPLNWIVEFPDVFRRFGARTQARIATRALRPGAAPWLRPHIGAVRFTMGREIAAARVAANEIVLTLDDGTERRADHIIAATGYIVDIQRNPFLPDDVVRRIRTVRGFPVLSRWFESSVPGLHFIGASSVLSFGPLMRFVYGAGYTARVLARCEPRHGRSDG